MKAFSFLRKAAVMLTTALWCLTASAAPTLLTFPDGSTAIKLTAGGQPTTLMVGVNTSEVIDFRSFQFTLNLPDGLSIVSAEMSDQPQFSNFKMTPNGNLAGRTGKVTMGAMDLTSPTPPTLSGPGYLFIVAIKADESASSSSGNITVTDVQFGTADGDDLPVQGTSTIPVTIEKIIAPPTLNVPTTPITIDAGEQTTLTVGVDSKDAFNFRSFQVNIDLPEGLRLMKAEKAGPLGSGFDLYPDIDADGRTGKVTIGAIDLSSPTGGSIGTTNEMFIVTLKADEDASPATGTIKVSDAIFGTSVGQDFPVEGSKEIPLTINVPVKSVTITPAQQQVTLGQSATFTAVLDPANPTNGEVQWSLDSDNYATIEKQEGLTVTVRSTGVGTATLKVTALGGTDVTNTATLVVNPVMASNVTLDKTNVTMLKSQQLQLTATVTPDNTTDQTIQWSTENGSVVTVEGGLLKAVGTGQTTVKATCGNVSASCEVTVIADDSWTTGGGDNTDSGDTDDDPAGNTANGAYFTGGDLWMRVNQTGTITLTPSQALTETPEITWAVTEGSIASMPTPGTGLSMTFRGLQVGTTTYTATLKDSGTQIATGTIHVIAQNPVTSITLDPSSFTIAANAAAVTVNASVQPQGATDTQLKWEVTDGTGNILLSPAQGGLSATVTPQQAGQATITVTAQDGSGTTATCTVTVKDITSIQPKPGDNTTENNGQDINPGEGTKSGAYLNGNDLTLRVGQTGSISIAVEPETEHGPQLEWTFNSSIASMQVDASTLKASFTGTSIGTATYTVKVKGTDSPSIQGTVTVIGQSPVMAIRVEPEEVSVPLNDVTFEVNAIVTPATASVTAVKWSSSNTQVATVDESTGDVTLLQEGSTDIIATTTDGTNLSAACALTVTAKVLTGITLSESKMTIDAGDNEIIRVVSYEPSEIENPEFNWTLSDDADGIASIEVAPDKRSVTVTAIAPGTCTLTATATDGSDASASCQIVVRKIDVKTISLKLANNVMKVSDSPVTLTAEVTPANATSPQLQWNVSNGQVAKIEKGDGLTATLTPLAMGTTEITVSLADNAQIQASASLTVLPEDPITKITISLTDITIAENAQPVTVSASIEPADASYQQLVWTLNEQDIVEIIPNELSTLNVQIKPLKAGSVTLTATAQDGTGITGTSQITVKAVNSGDITVKPGEGTGSDDTDDPVKDTENGPVFSGNDLTMRVGQTAKLILSATDIDYLPELEWSTGESSIATVKAGDDNTLEAVFTGAGVGKTTWSVKIKGENTVLASGNITVIAATPITAFTLSVNGDITMAANAAPVDVTATLSPQNASMPELKWEVSQSGSFIELTPATDNTLKASIAPKMAGVATVTVSTIDGSNISETFKVTVENVTNDNVTIEPGDGTEENEDDTNPGENTQKGGSLNGNNLTLRVNQEAGLKLTVSGDLDYAPEVVWSVAEGTVASVTPKADNSLEATFKGLAVGTTTYTVKLKGQEEVLVTGNITVIAETPITDITLSVDDITMALNAEPVEVTATVTPESASMKTLKWEVTSGDEFVGVAQGQNTLTATITAKQAGQATITVTAQDGSLTTTSFTVTVKAINSGDITVEPGDGTEENEDDTNPGENTQKGGSLNGNNLTLRVNQEAGLKLTVSGDLDYAPEVVWSVAESTVASVTANTENSLEATFKGLAVGTTTYTVKLKGQEEVLVTGNITVIAETPITDITLSVDDITMALNAEPVEVTATVTPEGASMKTLKWEVTSGDEFVGVAQGQNTLTATITAKQAGQATITVTAQDGSLTSTSFTVTVKAINSGDITVEPGDGTEENEDDTNPGENTQKGGSLNGNNLTLRVNQEAGLKLTVSGDLDYAPEVVWSVAEGTVASVTANSENSLEATFKGLAVGTTTYTVKLKGQDEVLVTGNVTVIAETPITDITLSVDDITMALNAEPVEVTATVTPESASMKTLKWEVTSGDEFVGVAQGQNTLSATITAKQAGQATITVTAQDGSLTSTSFTVTVKAVNSGDITVEPGDGTEENEDDTNPGENTQKGGSLNGNNLTLRVNQEAGLKLTVSGDLDYAPEVVWSVAEGTVASVTANTENSLEATFKGLAVGTTTYTVKLKGQDEVLVTGNVTVIAETPITDITLSVDDITMALNAEPVEVTATVTPEGASMKTLKWEVTSGDEFVGVAQGQNTLSATITAKQAGQATITVTAQDGSLTTTSFTVTVKAVNSGDITVEPGDGTEENEDDTNPGENTQKGGSLNGNNLTLRVNQEAGLKLTVSGDLDYAPEVVWSVAEGTVASVTPKADNSLEATFKGLAVGTTTYTVKLKGQDEVLVTGNVTVIAENPLLSLTLNPSQLEMALNQNPTAIEPVIEPADADITTFTWTSSDTAVATVDENGNVTPVAKGTAVITAKAQDGTDLQATANVTVTEPLAEDFEFDFNGDQGDAEIGADGVTLRVGDTYLLKVKAIEPEDAMLPQITWSSDAAAVASVSEDGLVTALSEGVATITATAIFNGKEITATCKVTVKAALSTDVEIEITPGSGNEPEGVEFTADGVKLEVGYSFTIPVNAKDGGELPEFTWTSSADDIAEVDEDGTVTGIAVGEAIVKATATVKGQTVEASCKIIVVPATVKELTLNVNEHTFDVPGSTLTLYATHGPVHAAAPTVKWTTSNSDIARVEDNGDMQATVYPVNTGKAVIRVEHTDNPNLYDECEVTVTEAASGIAAIFGDADIHAIDVYDLSGRAVKLQATPADLRFLKPGIYIMRNGTESKKVYIK